MDAAERFLLQARVLFAFVVDGDGAPAIVEVLARVVAEIERQPRLQAGVITFQMREFGVVAQRCQPGFGKGFPGDVALVADRVLVKGLPAMSRL